MLEFVPRMTPSLKVTAMLWEELEMSSIETGEEIVHRGTEAVDMVS